MRDRFNNSVGPQVRTGRKKSGKLVPVLAVLTLYVALHAATQLFARDMHYQPALGAHFREIYPPWAIVQWAAKWYLQYPDAFRRAGGAGILIASLGLIILAVTKMVMANTSKVDKFLHGSARWANKDDIEQAGLLPVRPKLVERLRGTLPKPHAGVYVGAWLDKSGTMHYLRHDGPEHVLTYAPTRSGKGVGLVVPTLLSWPESSVITDLKGELWAITAGWRQKHASNKVLRFEPASPDCEVFFNPLDEIRIGTSYEVGDVQNLATLVVDPDGKGLETHWQKTSQALLVGVILHALHKRRNEGSPASLPYVDHLLANPDRSVAELWMEMVTYGHVDGQPHPVVSAAARDMMDRPEEEAGSVLSTAKSYLSLYRDPVVAKNVGISNFRIRDLMNHDRPVSLYIVTQPNDKARLRPLVRVMVNMVVRLLADKLEFERAQATVPQWRVWLARAGWKHQSTSFVRAKRGYKHRLLGMIDEFPSLGRLEILQESLAFIAAYGIKLYLICQDINQLKSRETGYGPDETITSNCHVQNAYPPNRIETAEHLSKLTGTTTVAKEQITTSGKRMAVLIAGCAVLAAGALCYAAGARVNTTRSIPVGLYWTSDRPAERGTYVLLCPPQVGVVAEARRRDYLPAGFCPGGYGFMMKKIAALKEDVVDISDAGVAVNGVLLPLSAPLRHDGAGRPMPRYQATHFVIGNSEVLLMSDVSRTSFDGRYIGPVNRAQIRSVIVPVLVWHDNKPDPSPARAR